MLRLSLGEGTMQTLTSAMSVLLRPVIISEFLYSYMFYISLEYKSEMALPPNNFSATKLTPTNYILLKRVLSSPISITFVLPFLLSLNCQIPDPQIQNFSEISQGV